MGYTIKKIENPLNILHMTTFHVDAFIFTSYLSTHPTPRVDLVFEGEFARNKGVKLES